MFQGEYKTVDELYLDLCKNLLSASTINGTHELNNVCLQLDDVNDNIISIRDISKIYLLAELTWYFAGRDDVAFIGSFASLWKKISDDGITNNSAYGACMKWKYGFDQIETIIKLLKKDPASRRAVINLNIPNEFVIETKDELCTIALQFLIRDNKLNLTAIMRSNDVWFGLPYDIAFFTELQKYIASRLKIEAGTYTHFVTSMHLYDRDYDKIEKMVKNPKSIPVEFSRENFFNYYDAISDTMTEIIAANGNVKEEFEKYLRKYEVI